MVALLVLGAHLDSLILKTFPASVMLWFCGKLNYGWFEEKIELSTSLHYLADALCSGQVPPEQPQGIRRSFSQPRPLLMWIKPMSKESAPAWWHRQAAGTSRVLKLSPRGSPMS